MRRHVVALAIITILLLSFALGILAGCGAKVCVNCEQAPITAGCTRDRCRNCCRSSQACSDAGCKP